MDFYCQMAMTMIPAPVCESEQGKPECSGCKAPTRRCTRCGCVRNLTDIMTGLCAECAGSNTSQPRETISADEKIEGTLEVLQRVVESSSQTTLQEGEMMESHRGRTPQTTLAPSRLLEDVDALFLAFIEHREEAASGGWQIRNPRDVMRVRFFLTPDEITTALTSLRERKLIEGNEPWTAVKLLGEFDRPNHEAYSARKNIRSGARTQIAGPHRPRRDSSAMPEMMESVPVVRPLVSPPAARQNLPDAARVFDFLVERSTLIAGERVMRGAVPLLQMRFRVSPVAIVAVLERLVQEGRLVQRDEWRTLVIPAAGTSQANAEPEAPRPPAPVEEKPPYPRASVPTHRDTPTQVRKDAPASSPTDQPSSSRIASDTRPSGTPRLDDIDQQIRELMLTCTDDLRALIGGSIVAAIEEIVPFPTQSKKARRSTAGEFERTVYERLRGYVAEISTIMRDSAVATVSRGLKVGHPKKTARKAVRRRSR